MTTTTTTAGELELAGSRRQVIERYATVVQNASRRRLRASGDPDIGTGRVARQAMRRRREGNLAQ